MPESYTGDEGTVAFNAGLTIMDGTEDRRDGWLSINKVKDQLVTFATDLFNSISLSWESITGKPSTFPPAGHSHPITQITTADGSQNYGEALQPVIDGKLALTGGTLSGPLYLGSAAVVTSGYQALYINGDNRIGRSPSAERYKQDITDHPYTLDDATAVRIRDYRLRETIYGAGAGPVEVGVIAEELIAGGLSEFVVFNADGEAESVHYERLALVALGALHDVAVQLDLINDRLTVLEEA